MNNWTEKKISNLGSVTDGDWILNKHYAKSGVRLLQVGDIGLGKFEDKTNKFISKETAQELNVTFVIPGKDILISRMPDPIGRACIAPHLPHQYIVAVDISILKIDEKEFDIRYIMHLLNSNLILSKVEQRSAGATRVRISRTNLEQIDLILPLRPEQTAIANILSTVDEAIQKADEAINKTERIKQAMLQKLLTEGIGHIEFQETKIGRIPKEWECVKFNKYISVLGGFAFKSSDYTTSGIPLVRIANVSFGEILFDDLAYLPKSYLDKFSEYRIEKNDILIALTRPIISGGLKAAIINSEHTPALLNQRVAKINTFDEKKLQQNYLKNYILSTYFFNQMLQAQTSTNQPNVSTRQIENFHIIIPRPEEQIRISITLDDMQEKLKLSIKRKRYLERIKQGLMDDLLTGRKRIIIN